MAARCKALVKCSISSAIDPCGERCHTVQKRVAIAACMAVSASSREKPSSCNNATKLPTKAISTSRCSLVMVPTFCYNKLWTITIHNDTLIVYRTLLLLDFHLYLYEISKLIITYCRYLP